MRNPQDLFRLLSEFIVLLLGGLMVLLALTRRVGLSVRPSAIILLACLLIYWAARAWMRREPPSARLLTHIRAGSLVLVGILTLGIPVLPLRYANLLLGLAGNVLVLRGLLASFLLLKQPAQGSTVKRSP